MKKWIINYDLEILTGILAIVFGASLFFWNSLTLAGKALLGFMVLYTLHEWEESKFPGGFYDLFFGGFAVMERFFLRTVGLTFGDFRKMAMARVLENRK